MNIARENLSPTKTKLTVTARADELAPVKEQVLRALGQNVKVPGFRAGKAPVALIEKQLDQSALQTEFLEQAVNQLYVTAVRQQKLRPVAQPQIAITKFVPFETLEFTAETEIVGDIKLADYKKIKLASQPVSITAKDVNEVLDNLSRRGAAKQSVKRAAKVDDEVTIDFKGSDAKTGEPIDGADGKDYPLVLGSKTFIPGFEDKLVGLEAGAKKAFELTFPKDYNVKSLQSRKVKFEITVTKVQELAPAKLDDAFAASLGPFKTLAELKSDVKKQLTAEKDREALQAFDNELLGKIADKSTVAIPTSLVDEEIDQMEEEEKRNLAYRGQTWQEHLDAEGLSAEAHREQKREAAETRIKAGLILGEVAEQEDITVTPDELETRLKLLKAQYTDPAMQAELDKPESQRDLRGRLMTEKTLDKLRGYAATKSS